MHSKFLLVSLAASLVQAASIESRQNTVDNTQPVGTNPVVIKSQSYLGPIKSSNSCTHRDLGFWGKLSGIWYAVFGDTFYCKEPITDPAQDTPNAGNGFVRDMVAQGTFSPTQVQDLLLNSDSPVKHPNQFVRYDPAFGEDSSWGFGGTSICETNGTAKEGVVFYLRNANNAGLKGAGVGRVSAAYGVPYVIQRLGTNGYWWDSTNEARYGDQAAYRDENSDYIYAFGGAPTKATGFAGWYAYATRVHAAGALDLSQYEYFWGPGRGWLKTRLTEFSSNTAIMFGTGQGQVIYNPYYKKYLYVHLPPGGGQFLIRAAPNPWGPWTADVVAFNITSDGLPYEGNQPTGYAGTAMPWFDTSGKTLVVSYTLYSNQNPVHKITFA